MIGSPGLSDPCEKEPTNATDCLTNQQKEEVTASAQVCLVGLLARFTDVGVYILDIVTVTAVRKEGSMSTTTNVF